MGRSSTWIGFASTLAVAASCGGAAFSTGTGSDGGGDDGAAAPIDAAGNDTGASDGGGDAPGDTATDVRADVVAEAPATCGGSFACVPAVPAGWSGPVELFAGTSTVPPCTPGFAEAYDGNDGLNAPAPTCSCSCSATPTQCSAPSLTFYNAGVCAAGAGCYTKNLQASTCTKVDDQTGCGTVVVGSTRMAAAGGNVVGGGCSPQPGKLQVAPTWGTGARACASTTMVAQVDCQAGSVCAPRPATPFQSTLCVSQPGDLACPSSGYTSKHRFYGGVEDSRGCTACTCGALTGASCVATFEAYSSSDGSCSTGGISYAAPFSCDPVQQPADVRLTIVSQDGSCAANAVSATGSAIPANATTVCCLP